MPKGPQFASCIVGASTEEVEQRVQKWADLEPSENHDSDHTPEVEAQSRAHSEAQKGLEKLIESGADQASIDLARNISSL